MSILQVLFLQILAQMQFWFYTISLLNELRHSIVCFCSIVLNENTVSPSLLNKSKFLNESFEGMIQRLIKDKWLALNFCLIFYIY